MESLEKTVKKEGKENQVEIGRRKTKVKVQEAREQEQM